MPSASYRLSETIWVSEAKGTVTTPLPDMTKYRSVSIEKHRSRNDIFSDKVYDMMKEKHNDDDDDLFRTKRYSTHRET